MDLKIVVVFSNCTLKIAFVSSPGEVRCVTTLPTGGLAFGSMETWHGPKKRTKNPRVVVLGVCCFWIQDLEIFWVVATQIFLEFSPRNLGKMNPI